MPIRLGTNVTALNAARHLNRNSADFAKRVERLSSGLRINRGADDAADHLRLKHRRGKRYATSAETFIDRLASKSS